VNLLGRTFDQIHGKATASDVPRPCEVSSRPAPSRSGDINAEVDNAAVEELLVKIKEEYRKLGSLSTWREPQQSRTEHGVTVAGRAIKHRRRPGA
jgi:hypothetical protein